MITPVQLKQVFPACRDPGMWCRTFDQMVDEFELRPPHRLAMFLAQTGYESQSFNVLRERMSYRTAAALLATFPAHFKTEDDARPYVLVPDKLANYVYANRLGNGDVASGDGLRYRGGGLIQLTGRANYKGVGDALGLDLEIRPNQIELPPIAARTAGFFWKQNDLNAAADAVDFDYTTRRINGSAMLGKDERRALWQKLVVVLGAISPQAAAEAARRAVPPVIDGVMDPAANRNL
jgi:putative chitinase